MDSSGSKNAARGAGVDAEPGAVVYSGEENRRIVRMPCSSDAFVERNIFWDPSLQQQTIEAFAIDTLCV